MAETNTPIPKPRFTGLFIPAEVLDIEELNHSDHLLLAWIDALQCKEHGGCYASNQYFAKKLKLKENTIQVIIAKLKKLDLVRQISFNGRVRILISYAWFAKCQSRSDHDLNHGQTMKEIMGRPLKKSRSYIDSKVYRKEEREQKDADASISPNGDAPFFSKEEKNENQNYGMQEAVGQDFAEDYYADHDLNHIITSDNICDETKNKRIVSHNSKCKLTETKRKEKPTKEKKIFFDSCELTQDQHDELVKIHTLPVVKLAAKKLQMRKAEEPNKYKKVSDYQKLKDWYIPDVLEDPKTKDLLSPPKDPQENKAKAEEIIKELWFLAKERGIYLSDRVTFIAIGDHKIDYSYEKFDEALIKCLRHYKFR